MKSFLSRPDMCDRILTDTNATVVLRAPAGAGKSVLLAQLSARLGVPVCTLQHPRPTDIVNGWLLWDVPVGARAVRLSAPITEAATHLIIACRPDQRLTGFARRELHDGATTLGAADLCFTPGELSGLPVATATRLRDDYACWPAFLPLAQTHNPPLATDYVAETFLNHLSPAQTTALSIWLESPSPVDDPTDIGWADALPPFLRTAPTDHAALTQIFRTATALRRNAFSNSSAVTEVATALEAAQRPLDAISLLLDHGHESHAAQVLEHSHGLELIYSSNLDEFSTIILRFSQEMIATNETVLFAITRTLMKMGEIQRVRHLVAKHLGSDYLDPLKVLVRGSRFSFAARRFRLNLMISEDMTPTDAMLQRLGEFMADYPVGDDQKWAAFYNALLEFEVRRRNFQEAEAAAARALLYFRKMGGHPLLEFFIHLHQTVLHLTNGDVMLARTAARTARARLESVPHSALPEFRMLRLTEAAIAYEEGHPQTLVAFVQTEFEAFASAEIWPSLFVFAIHYSSQALMDNFPATIRPGFMDGLWLHLAERLNLHRLMEIRTATAYQNAGRWTEAEGILDAIRDPDLSDGAGLSPDDLRQMSGRDEIAFAMARLRAAAHAQPPPPGLENQLRALEANPKTTLREKIALQLWRAYVDHQRRDLTSARRNLQSALASVVGLGCFGVLAEQSVFLAPLLREARIRSHVETAHGIRAALAIYAGSITSPRARARAGGLTERETQLLQLIADGYPTKRISQTLGIAEPTAKFHLSHLYTKLGCRKRAEAIQAARALGWL